MLPLLFQIFQCDFFNYTERWYTKKVMRDWDSDAGKEVLTDTIHGFHRVYNYNTSLGVSTKLYGMYKPLFAKKKEIQIRHVITRKSV